MPDVYSTVFAFRLTKCVKPLGNCDWSLQQTFGATGRPYSLAALAKEASADLRKLENSWMLASCWSECLFQAWSIQFSGLLTDDGLILRCRCFCKVFKRRELLAVQALSRCVACAELGSLTAQGIVNLCSADPASTGGFVCIPGEFGV